MKLQYSPSESPGEAPRSVEVRRDGSGLEVVIDGRTLQVDGGFTSPGVLQIRIDGRPLRVVTASAGDTRFLAHRADRFALQRVDAGGARRGRHHHHDTGALTATMPGQVLKVLVAVGDEVKKGQALVIIEAMKMEHEVKAPFPGRVKRLGCAAGQMVAPGVELAEIEETS